MKKCPKCNNNLICELQLDEEKNESYLHEYCINCGYDKPVDPFNQRYREKMSEFMFEIKNKQDKDHRSKEK